MIAFIKKHWHLHKIKNKETIKCYGPDNTLLAEMQLSKKELESLKKKLELWKKQDLVVKAFCKKAIINLTKK